MDSSTISGIIGLIHSIGFVILLAIVKLWLKKKISARKLMTYYIIVFLVGLIIFSIITLSLGGYRYDLASMIGSFVGELFGFGIGFLIVDYVILTIGSWIFKKRE